MPTKNSSPSFLPLSTVVRIRIPSSPWGTAKCQTPFFLSIVYGEHFFQTFRPMELSSTHTEFVYKIRVRKVTVPENLWISEKKFKWNISKGSIDRAQTSRCELSYRLFFTTPLICVISADWGFCEFFLLLGLFDFRPLILWTNSVLCGAR